MLHTQFLLRSLVTLLLVSCSSQSPRLADTEVAPDAVVSAQREAELDDFVLGNFTFVLIHELAHVVLSEKQIPVLGSHESAADNIATVLLTSGEQFNVRNPEKFRKFAGSALQAFDKSWQMSTDMNQAIPYWDTHSLGIQRYYSILCLMSGGHTNNSNLKLTRSPDLPPSRAAGCEYEYKQALQGAKWILNNYGLQPGQVSGAKARFEYGQPRSLRQQHYLKLITEQGLFEYTVNELTTRFALPDQFTARIMSCRRPEAAWQPEKRELVICYEIFDAFEQIYFAE